MNKILQKTTLILLLGIALCSCGDSKFDKTVSLLDALPVFIADQKVNQEVVYADNTINITIPDQGQLYTQDGTPVTDDMIITVFLQDLLNNNIAIYALGQTLNTKEGESPIEDFLSRAEKKNVDFVIEYNETKIKLTPNEVRNRLKGI